LTFMTSSPLRHLHQRIVRGSSRGQSAVEFGIVVMAFVMLLCGIFDFGMLLTGWVSASSAASVAAREAAIGIDNRLNVIVATAQSSAGIPGVSQSALKVAVTDVDTGKVYCLAASKPADVPSCASDTSTVQTGDHLKLTLVADKFEVMTMPVRLAFGCTGSQPCYVPITASATVRYEGTYVS
jgi:Flp pilus assembly protein TadG